MANWCSTKYAFYTKDEDKGELLRFYGSLINVMKSPSAIPNDFGSGWLGNVLDRHGLDWEAVPCRGYISHIDDSPDENSFTIETEAAWEPVTALWEAVLATYNGVSFVYVAEEPGNTVYINTDTLGRFFPDRYLLDIFGDGQIPENWYPGQDKPSYLDIREYFNDFASLSDYCVEIMDKQFHSVAEIDAFLSDTFDGQSLIHANIHEFKTA